MKEVTQEEFYEFLKDRGLSYTIRKGIFTNQETYIDNKTTGIIAIKESNPNSNESIYHILAIT